MSSSPRDRSRLRLVASDDPRPDARGARQGSRHKALRIAAELEAWNRPVAANGAAKRRHPHWELLPPRPKHVHDAKAQLRTIVTPGLDDVHDLVLLRRDDYRGPADWRLEWSSHQAPALAVAAPTDTASVADPRGRHDVDDVSWRELVRQLRRRIRFATRSRVLGPRFVVVRNPRPTAIQLATG